MGYKMEEGVMYDITRMMEREVKKGEMTMIHGETKALFMKLRRVKLIEMK